MALLGGAAPAFSLCGYETVRTVGGGRPGAALLMAVGGWIVGLAATATGAFLTLR